MQNRVWPRVISNNCSAGKYITGCSHFAFWLALPESGLICFFRVSHCWWHALKDGLQPQSVKGDIPERPGTGSLPQVPWGSYMGCGYNDFFFLLLKFLSVFFKFKNRWGSRIVQNKNKPKYKILKKIFLIFPFLYTSIQSHLNPTGNHFHIYLF